MARELYNNGSAVRTQPGSDARAGTSSRGVSIDSAALMGAIDVAMLDPSGVAAEGRGYAALGQGVANVGDAFSKVAEIQARQYNVNTVSKANNIMAEGESELAEMWLKEPDEMKWMELSNQKAAEIQTRLGKLNMSLDAKDEVESRYSSWKVKLLGETRVNSARKTRGDFESELKGELANARLNGDQGGADQAAERLHSAGVLTDGEFAEEKTRNRLAAEQYQNVEASKREKAAIESYIGAAIVSPQETLDKVSSKDFGKEEGLDPSAIMSIRSRVRETANFNKGKAVEDVMDKIWSDDPEKQIITDKQVDAINDPNIDETDKKKMKLEIAHRKDASTQRWYKENAPLIASKLSLSIDSYNPTEDESVNKGAHTRAFNLRNQIMRLPEGMRTPLLGSLKRKEFPSTDNGDRSVFEIGDSLLKQSFLQNQSAYSADSAEPSSDPLLGINKAPASKMPMEERIKAASLYSKARDEWRTYLSAHPEATIFEGDAMKEFERIQGAYHLDSVHAAPVLDAPPSLYPVQPGGGVDGGIPADVDNILKQLGAPPADKPKKAVKGKAKQGNQTGFIEPPLPGSDLGEIPESSLPVDTSASEILPSLQEDTSVPPYPDFAGEGLVSVDESRIKQMKEGGMEEVSVFDQESQAWKKVAVDDLEGHDYLITP